MRPAVSEDGGGAVAPPFVWHVCTDPVYGGGLVTAATLFVPGPVSALCNGSAAIAPWPG